MDSTSKMNERAKSERWPALPYAAWRETREALHLWTQIVGKVRLVLTPPCESLVAHLFLCHGAWADDVSSSLSRRQL
jgi:hypothetical protein